MKKKKSFLALFISLSLVSCGKHEAVRTLPAEFDADVCMVVGKDTYKAVYEKRDGFDRLLFSEPAKLCGLELELSGNTVAVTFGDLSFESDVFSSAFDFLPVECDTVKTVGNREYRIDIRE